MNCKEPFVDYSRDGEGVEEVDDDIVNLLVVLGETCVRQGLHSCRKLK